MPIFSSIVSNVGQTPLVRLQRLDRDIQASILVKLEFQNPLFSVKDRVGAAMIAQAEAEEAITGQTVIVEPTSGNTGIALAFVCASKGYRLCLTMPENMSQERQKLLKHLGAELVLTPAAEGIAGAVQAARDILDSNPDALMPNQFRNPANPRMHEQTTGPEIWADTQGRVDAVIAGVGTGGTITGVSRCLKSHRPDVAAVAVEPAGSPVLSGGKPGSHLIQGIGAGFIPETLDLSLVDRIMQVTDQDALDTARRMAAEEGIACGISSGAAMAAALELGRSDWAKGKQMVVILPSAAERYMSTDLFRS